MYSPSSTRAKGFVYSCLALCFLALAAYKAYFLAFTHDESLSYLDYVIGRNSWEVISFAHHASANNHPLNSLLMKGCNTLFGAAEWALRAAQSLVGSPICLCDLAASTGPAPPFASALFLGRQLAFGPGLFQ